MNLFGLHPFQQANSGLNAMSQERSLRRLSAGARTLGAAMLFSVVVTYPMAVLGVVSGLFQISENIGHDSVGPRPMLSIAVPPIDIAKSHPEIFQSVSLNENTSFDNKAILRNILAQRIALRSDFAPPDLSFYIQDGKVNFSTDAHYATSEPNCVGKTLDFEIAASTSLGLRGYIFDTSKGCVAFQVGEYDTSYYAVTFDPDRMLTAYAIPGKGRIEVFDENHIKIHEIKGINASAVEFDPDGALWMVGWRESDAWDKASLFKFDLVTGKSEAFLAGQLADGRGIAFNDDQIAVADTFHHRVLIIDQATNAPKLEMTGFSYPNGLSFAENGDLLIADEHHHAVRRFSSKSWQEVWRSPNLQLLSPGSVEEINFGKFAGNLLISDTDGGRIIVVDPKTWTIQHEISNLNGAVDATAVFDPKNRAVPSEPEKYSLRSVDGNVTIASLSLAAVAIHDFPTEQRLVLKTDRKWRNGQR